MGQPSSEVTIASQPRIGRARMWKTRNGVAGWGSGSLASNRRLVGVGRWSEWFCSMVSSWIVSASLFTWPTRMLPSAVERVDLLLRHDRLASHSLHVHHWRLAGDRNVSSRRTTMGRA